MGVNLVLAFPTLKIAFLPQLCRFRTSATDEPGELRQTNLTWFSLNVKFTFTIGLCDRAEWPGWMTGGCVIRCLTPTNRKFIELIGTIYLPNILHCGTSLDQYPSSSQVNVAFPTRIWPVEHSMVTVVPVSEAAQFPCVDPSTVNPGHTVLSDWGAEWKDI